MGIDCSVTQIQERDTAILRVQGELDFDERGRFEGAVQELMASRAKRLIIDMSMITRMSSVYIGTLVERGHALHTEGRKLSVSVPKQVGRICRESGLDKITNLIVSDK